MHPSSFGTRPLTADHTSCSDAMLREQQLAQGRVHLLV